MKLDLLISLRKQELQDIFTKSSSSVLETKVLELQDLLSIEKDFLKRLPKEIETKDIKLEELFDTIWKKTKKKLGDRPEGIIASLDGTKDKWDTEEKKINEDYLERIDKESDELERLEALFEPSQSKIRQYEHTLKLLLNILAGKRKKERYARLSSYEGKTRQTGQTIIQKIRNETEEYFLCPYCKEESKKEDSHVDHIYPVSKGGLSTETNMVLVCSSCNLKKKDRTLYNFSKLNKLDFEEIVSQLELLGKVV